MSIDAARALIGWRTSSGSCHNYCASLWKGGENHEPPRFCIEVNVPRGGQKLAILWLHHGATPQSAVEATVDLHDKAVCFNHLFGDVNVFSIVFQCFTIFIFMKFLPPLPPLRSLH